MTLTDKAAAWDLFQSGASLFVEQKYVDALAQVDAGLDLDPDSVSGYALRGHMLSRLLRLEEAQVAVLRALDLAPRLMPALDRSEEEKRLVAYAYEVLGHVLVRLAARDKGKDLLHAAAEVYDHAVQLDQNNPSAYYGIGYCSRKLGHKSGAVKAFERAVALKSDYTDAYVALSKAELSMLHFSSALRALANVKRILLSKMS